MRIDGYWHVCDDGIVRPVLAGEVNDAAGRWRALHLLVDSGADQTVLSADVLHTLGVDTSAPSAAVEGVGGRANIITLETKLRLFRETGDGVLFKGKFAAMTDPRSLDMSVLGRDITNMFALIVDRPQDVVALLGKGHRYGIAAG
jgi:hypothetical protein